MSNATIFNRLKAAINDVLSSRAATAEATEAEQPAATDTAAADPALRLNELRHMIVPPSRVPMSGHVYINDRDQRAIEDLDDEQRWTMEVLEPLQHEWMEAHLWVADIAFRTNAAMDYRENTWGARKTQRQQAGLPVSGSAPCLDRSVITERTFQDRVRYDDLKMKRALELIEECLAKGDIPEFHRKVISVAFKPNAKGMYSRTDLARLRKIESSDPKWQEAINLTIQAESPDGSAGYLMLKVRDANNKFHSLPLNIAAVRPYPRDAQSLPMPRPIRTAEQHQAALAQVKALMDKEPAQGSPEGELLEVLAILIEAYERKAFPEVANG